MAIHRCFYLGKSEEFWLAFLIYLHYIKNLNDLKMALNLNADHKIIIQIQIGLKITLFSENILGVSFK